MVPGDSRRRRRRRDQRQRQSHRAAEEARRHEIVKAEEARRHEIFKAEEARRHEIVKAEEARRHEIFKAEEARRHEIVKAVVERLPPDIYAQIHHRLDFLRRLSFASILGASGHMLRQEAPWLILPDKVEVKDKPKVERSKVVSMADERSAAFVRTAIRGHVVIGSSDGWLVTADDRAVLRMANPATGAMAPLPPIDTIPFLYSLGGGGHWFCLDVGPFVQVRFGGPAPPEDKDWGPTPPRSSTLTAAQMRQRFYRKVVLSSSSTPASYAAMLLTYRHIGAPAFATAAGGAWRLARSPDGVEDAVHHGGRFYSVTYAGDVEAWDSDAETGEFTSRVVAPRLELDYDDDKKLRRKYLAVSADGQLMAVLKLSAEVQVPGRYHYETKTIRHVSFKVLVLAQGNHARWEAAPDIGESALFVGVNGSVCVSTREHRGIGASCVYFTDDEVGDASLRKEQGGVHGVPEKSELREAGIYNLRTGRVQRIAEQGNEPHWPPPAWFTPSFL